MTTTSAREFSVRLADLLRREHLAMADFLVALATFDRDRGWVELGYSSLFDYLHRDLGLSKGAAFYRMTAAHLLQAHPEVIEPLRDGRLCLSTVVELSKALTAAGPGEVLPRFFHASKREAKAVVAELLPERAVPLRVVVTAVRSPVATPLAANPPPSIHAGATSDAPTELDPSALAGRAADLGQSVHPANQADDLVPMVLPANRSGDVGQVQPANREAAPGHPPRPSAPVLVEEPMTAELSRIHVTVPRRLLAKLDAARAALSHSHPGAGTDQILEVGLDLILERHAKRRGIVKNPRAPKVRSEAKAQANRPAAASEATVHDQGKEPANMHVETAQEAQIPAAGAGADEPSASPGQRPVRERSQAELAEPRRASRAPIPAHVKRAVWLRDGGRCQWPVEGGGVCGSTLRVEIDHVVPVGRGGSSNVDDLECICAFHNQLAARQAYGNAFMARFTGRGGNEPSGPRR